MTNPMKPRSLPGMFIRPIPQVHINFTATQWALEGGTESNQHYAARDLNDAFNKFVNARSDAFGQSAKGYATVVPQYTRAEVEKSMERYLVRNSDNGATLRATRDQLKYASDMVYGAE